MDNNIPNEKKRSHSCSEEEEKQIFTPREYQIEILECARKENTIACLGTGTGKTFIAVMLIRENAFATRAPYSEGGKRIFFLVPTVPLVSQQEKAIKLHTDLKVKGYCGEMDVDSWEIEDWKVEFEENQVLVMTAEIFRIIIDHSFMSIEKIQLLVFDECHRAQGDHPYRLAMKNISSQKEEIIPRIFGLSASLLNGKCKPQKLEKNLRELEITLRSTITTSSDVMDIQKYGTDPDEYIVFFQTSEDDSDEDISSFVEQKIVYINQLLPKKEAVENENSFLQEQETNFFEKPKKCLRQIQYILSNLGVWCAHEACKVFLKDVNELCDRPYNMEYKKVLIEIREFLEVFMRKCENKGLKINSKSLSSSTHKMQRLIELFAQIKISEKFKLALNYDDFNEDLKFSDAPEQYHKKLKQMEEYKKYQTAPICSIIFVEQRITAYVLCQWILEVTKNIPGFEFMKPMYMVGHGKMSTKLSGDYNSMSVRKQKKILTDFRNKETNILIATSVLEEGMDIQQCNVVVRFDPPLDFRSYVQSKGRARAKNSIYVVLINSKDDTKFLEDLCNFKTIEQMLLAKCHNRDMPDQEDIQENMANDQIPPFMPFGVNGPRINSTSSISLINRYCSKLPSDMTTKLVPKWKVKIIDPEVKRKKFICELRMPINSPLKETISGEEMPQKRLAKMSAALKACERLHEIGELNEHLVPISNLVDKAFEAEMGEFEKEICEPGVQPGTNRRRQIYCRKVPTFLRNAKPVARTPCYLHIIETKLKVPLPASLNPRRRKLIDPSKSTSIFGLLLTEKLPKVCNFPIFTKSGKVEVHIKTVESILHLSEVEIKICEEFHRYIFNNVFKFEEGKEFAPNRVECSYYIIPVNKGSSCEIDWDFMKKTKEHQKSNMKKRGKTEFSEKLFKDAVLQKSYADYIWEGIRQEDARSSRYHLVQKICYDLSPSSPFPIVLYPTFKDYYEEKYNVDVIDLKQPLVETVQCDSFIMWKPKYTKIGSVFDETKASLSKTKQNHKNYREHLIPELCVVHPFPVHFFQNALCLPTILFRLKSFLLAEELRQNIASAVSVGTASLKPEFQWPSFNFETSDMELTNHLVSTGELVKDDTNVKFVPRDIIATESRIVSFEAKVNLKDDPGPCPSILLQALTSKSTGDEFNLERLEMIGDSFLKYAMSAKIYNKYPTFDEGKLSRLRINLIRNLNLYQCAKKKKLAEYMICTKFDCNETWLPPCYDVDETVDHKALTKKGKADEDSDSDIQAKFFYFKSQIIADKCVADCVEALIGAYLLTCGQQGALRFMYWLGLNPTNVKEPSDHDFENWPGLPKCPVLDMVPTSRMQLFDGFEGLEAELKYKFKIKAFLLQALTHPSYSFNDITDCYQRLEFIGDAVLDYLITRQLYEIPQNHTPGELTDLRSALVNNIYFASLAVKHGFHKYLKMSSAVLFKLIKTYVEVLEESEAFHFFMENSYYLGEIECFELEEVEVPKALGDLVESIAGAIYLDSGMSLDAVWRVFEPLMKPAIEHYCKHLPKSPVREMYELVFNIEDYKKMKPKELFKETIVKENKTFVHAVLPDGKKYCGVGPNKTVAKRSCAKRIIADFRKENGKA